MQISQPVTTQTTAPITREPVAATTEPAPACTPVKIENLRGMPLDAWPTDCDSLLTLLLQSLYPEERKHILEIMQQSEEEPVRQMGRMIQDAPESTEYPLELLCQLKALLPARYSHSEEIDVMTRWPLPSLFTKTEGNFRELSIIPLNTQDNLLIGYHWYGNRGGARHTDLLIVAFDKTKPEAPIWGRPQSGSETGFCHPTLGLVQFNTTSPNLRCYGLTTGQLTETFQLPVTPSFGDRIAITPDGYCFHWHKNEEQGNMLYGRQLTTTNPYPSFDKEGVSSKYEQFMTFGNFIAIRTDTEQFTIIGTDGQETKLENHRQLIPHGSELYAEVVRENENGTFSFSWVRYQLNEHPPFALTEVHEMPVPKEHMGNDIQCVIGENRLVCTRFTNPSGHSSTRELLLVDMDSQKVTVLSPEILGYHFDKKSESILWTEGARDGIGGRDRFLITPPYTEKRILDRAYGHGRSNDYLLEAPEVPVPE